MRKSLLIVFILAALAFFFTGWKLTCAPGSHGCGFYRVTWVDPLFAGEQIDLTVPDQAITGTSRYYVARLDMDWDAVRVVIYLNSPSGIKKTLSFSGADAMNYMKALNKRNAATTSNLKWTLEQLISKGWLAGTVSGTPD